MIPWIYKDNVLDPSDTLYGYGFVYKITYLSPDNIEYTYYGKKNLFSIETKSNPSKEETALKYIKDGYTKIGFNLNGKRMFKFQKKVKSNWFKYNGSGKHIPKDFKIVSKEILVIELTSVNLSFREAEILFKNNVLFDKYNLNYNIAGKFYCGTGTNAIIGSKSYFK